MWREARYDYAALGQELPSLLSGRPFDLWRYRELLPVRNTNPSLKLGEGGTPLIQAINLGMMLGTPNLYIKDERQGPTGSFKDRQAAVTIAALKEAGITEMVAASTGNVAISYSAYASRAGVKLWAFVTSLVPAVKMREIALTDDWLNVAKYPAMTYQGELRFSGDTPTGVRQSPRAVESAGVEAAMRGPAR